MTASASLLMLLPASLLLGACDVEKDGQDDIGAPGDEEADPSDDPAEDPADDPDEEPSDDPEEPSDDLPSEPQPEAAVPCELDSWGGEACTTEDGEEGQSFCILVDGEEFHTPCEIEPPACQPGEGYDQGCIGEICYWDGEAFRWYSWAEPDCDTPLVVSFDGGPIEFAPAVAASFDLSSDGSCMSTDWPMAPWLALDRDGDGLIRDGGELFGNATKMASGGHAEHGFAALAELDSNRDGKITPADERFGELVLWSDLDDDRIGAHAELRPVSETTLVSIDLGFDRRASCDRQGNCGWERAALEYRTPEGSLAVGEVVDVHLACR